MHVLIFEFVKWRWWRWLWNLKMLHQHSRKKQSPPFSAFLPDPSVPGMWSMGPLLIRQCVTGRGFWDLTDIIMWLWLMKISTQYNWWYQGHCRGEREFPFPVIPGNTSLKFPFPSLPMAFYNFPGWGRGELEFPFPVIPGNTSLKFPFPSHGSFKFPFPLPGKKVLAGN